MGMGGVAQAANIPCAFRLHQPFGRSENQPVDFPKPSSWWFSSCPTFCIL